MSETNTLAGRPINGDINYYSTNPTDQKPIGEFLDALDALLAFPEVEAVRWEQYTPYFNDGEACEFGAGDAYVKFVDDDESGESEDGFRDASGTYPPGYFDTHEYKERRYNHYTHQYEPSPDNDPAKADVEYKDRDYYVNGVIRRDLEAAHRAFSRAVAGGAHEVDLRKHFGDPAQVTATRAGFDVEYYDHD